MANRQRNIVFPDTVRNDRFVNVLLWKGDPHATRVQRIGIALIAIGPFSLAAMVISVGWDSLPDPVAVLCFLLAFPFIVFGCRLLRNAFLRSPSKSDQE